MFNNLDLFLSYWLHKFWDSLFYFLETAAQNYKWAWVQHPEWWGFIHLVAAFLIFVEWSERHYR